MTTITVQVIDSLKLLQSNEMTTVTVQVIGSSKMLLLQYKLLIL